MSSFRCHECKKPIIVRNEMSCYNCHSNEEAERWVFDQQMKEYHDLEGGVKIFHEEKWKIFEEIIKVMSEEYINGGSTIERAIDILSNYEFLSPKKWWDYDE